MHPCRDVSVAGTIVAYHVPSDRNISVDEAFDMGENGSLRSGDIVCHKKCFVAGKFNIVFPRRSLHRKSRFVLSPGMTKNCQL